MRPRNAKPLCCVTLSRETNGSLVTARLICFPQKGSVSIIRITGGTEADRHDALTALRIDLGSYASTMTCGKRGTTVVWNDPERIMIPLSPDIRTRLRSEGILDVTDREINVIHEAILFQHVLESDMHLRVTLLVSLFLGIEDFRRRCTLERIARETCRDFLGQ